MKVGKLINWGMMQIGDHVKNEGSLTWGFGKKMEEIHDHNSLSLDVNIIL